MSTSTLSFANQGVAGLCQQNSKCSKLQTYANIVFLIPHLNSKSVDWCYENVKLRSINKMQLNLVSWLKMDSVSYLIRKQTYTWLDNDRQLWALS